jgi:hypothetical protein
MIREIWKHNLLQSPVDEHKDQTSMESIKMKRLIKHYVQQVELKKKPETRKTMRKAVKKQISAKVIFEGVDSKQKLLDPSITYVKTKKFANEQSIKIVTTDQLLQIKKFMD